MCDSSNIDINNRSLTFLTKEKPAQFYKDTGLFNVITLEDSYNRYLESTVDIRFIITYIMAIVIAFVVVCVVINSAFKVEKDIKLNMLKYVFGNSNKNIVLGEIVKSVGLFIIPLLLVMVAVPIVGAIVQANSAYNIMTMGNLFIAAGIVFAIYVFSISVTLLRTVLAKPLNELRKD